MLNTVVDVICIFVNELSIGSFDSSVGEALELLPGSFMLLPTPPVAKYSGGSVPQTHQIYAGIQTNDDPSTVVHPHAAWVAAKDLNHSVPQTGLRH